MPISESTLGWYVIGRRIVLCTGLALFFGGIVQSFTGADNPAVPVGAFILGFFIPLRELQIARGLTDSRERII